ncbi:ADP-ribosylation factor-like protein 6 [Paramacrobiotus metropolitanus]|uniref:ADP-ribosylation factor-like protein 6 n=1 Tax=Paramacrobiotus metropolitanus TaxID=2943436 RepID=UPI0024456A40|nr:ADP-ribosylation factor-like protein 6 [Paramacrobiotus metropolitanus]XP_055346404.1 ADP-ribosylation factor-like protein 6 [Paramacrobiotus metropolitanus]XP_055346405.1 ADP-ribosylation factor-like protein 6 [Paramacrobiotus metropolitanus]
MGILDKIVSALGTGPRTYHILVVGLDNSGKSTIINFLKPDNLRVSGEIPPTVGVKIEKVKYKNTILQFHDMSGQGKYRAMWERCFSDCHAIIFVVDSSDKVRVVVAKEEFDGLVQHPAMQERSIPLLVLANKKDQPNGIAATRCSQLFELEKLLANRTWHLQATNALTGEGVHEAFNWLTDYLASLPADGRGPD